jgi:2-oxoisovalerate dehydrogenase E1 component
MSPRLKAYCRNEKVVPISLHRSFKGHGTGIRSEDKANQFYEDVILSKQQERLLNNLVESQERVIQANVQCMCDNACIDQYRQRLRNSKQKNVVPSRLEIISWSVVDAMRKHPNFRSRLILPNTLRQFKNTNLGIAVALQNDELRTAIVPDVLSCDFMQFVQQVRRSIGDAKEDNHVTTYHSLVISDLSTQGIVNAIPIVSHPSCATLFVGCPVQYDKKSFYLSLSFDHRFINGAGAAAFLMDVQHNIKIVTH